MSQRHNGLEVYSWSWTNNEQGSTGETGWIGGYDQDGIGMFFAYNKQRGKFGMLEAAGTDNFIKDYSALSNEDNSGTPKELNVPRLTFASR